MTRLAGNPASGLAVISGLCKFHPKMPARFVCANCRSFFCDACVAIRRAGGAQQRFCRRCGAECTPIEVQLAPIVEQSFLARVPGAFIYPVRGAGVFIVFVGIVLFAFINWGQACIQFRTIRLIGFGIILEIFAGGYLFTYLQCIIHATTAEEPELPDPPGVGNFAEDVIVPFCRLLGLLLACFGPAAGLAIGFASTHQVSVGIAALAAGAFGCFYFPMAFLAVAVLDSLAAANPLLVVPSILKVPLEYFIAILVLASAFACRWLGDALVNRIFPDGWMTGSMGTLFGVVVVVAFVSFMTLYLLVVGIHLLGLVFVTKKETLGWMNQ